MSEKVIPSIAIMLDKERHFRFTLGAIIRFQKATGKDLRKKEVAAAMEKDMDIEELTTFMWACLYWEDKNLTIEDVSDLIDINNLEDIKAKFYEAIKVAMPAPALSQSKGGSEDNPPLARKKSRTG
jgi:hypothetical protein